MSARPATPPTSPPALANGTPLSTPPRPGMVLDWIRMHNGGWYPAWALPGTGGLMITAETYRADSSLDWHLAITHQASGLRVVAGRANGERIPAAAAGERLMHIVMRELLSLSVDWTSIVHAERADPEVVTLVRSVVLRRLPAIPEWRAWRLDGVSAEPVCRWFKTEAAALRWADRAMAWYLVERWDSPPPSNATYTRGVRPDFVALARGELPDGMTVAQWRAWGVNTRATAEFEALRDECPLRPNLLALRAAVYQRVDTLERAPTGEFSPDIAWALERGLAEIRPHEAPRLGGGVHRSEWLVPTLRGLLALSRHVFADHVAHIDTESALITWRSLAARDRGEDHRGWDLGGAALRRERLDAWLRLLACLRRDRAAYDAGQPRLDLPRRAQGGEVRVLSIGAGVVCLEVWSSPWRWLTYRARPAVPWAPRSALAVADVDDGFGGLMSSLREHSRREWAEEHAADLRKVCPCEEHLQ